MLPIHDVQNAYTTHIYSKSIAHIIGNIKYLCQNIANRLGCGTRAVIII